MSDVPPGPPAPLAPPAPFISAPPATISAHVPYPRPDADQPPVDEAERGSGERFNDALDRATAASGRVASTFVDRMRNNAELGTERGTTTIADEVVEKIAGIATREVPGVHDLGGDVARVFAGLRERIGLGDADDDTDRGIRVRLDGRTASVEITLVIEYGYVVRAVTEKVRANVIGAVENLLDLQVTEVNIRVDDVHVPDGASSTGAPA
jgi:uncharacterized alkaline shock family protein YloU